MKTVTINGDDYWLPVNWNELSAEQLLAISRMSLQPQSAVEIKVKALFYLLGFTVERMKERIFSTTLEEASTGNAIPREQRYQEEAFYVNAGNKHVYLLGSADIVYLSNQMNFLFSITKDDEGKVSYQFQSKLFRQLIPAIKIKEPHPTIPLARGGNILYGPADGLNNLLFSEFVIAENYYANFIKNPQSQNAELLIATLYRPQIAGYNANLPEHGTDCREPINDNTIIKRAVAIAKIKPELRQAILFWYEGCKWFLRGKFPHVFDVSTSLDKPCNSRIRSNKQSVFEDYLKLVSTLAKNDATRVDAWMNTPLYTVMTAMENLRLEQIEMEKVYHKGR